MASTVVRTSKRLDRTRTAMTFSNTETAVGASETTVLDKFDVAKDSSPKVGGGVKTHIKTPKRRGRPPKSKAKPKTKIQEKVDKAIKEPKPKGLKKAKKEKAD